MNINKTWGKEIWEEKIKKQSPEMVIGGSLATEEKLKKETKKTLIFLDKRVLLLIKQNGKIIDVGIGPLARYSIEFAKRGYNVIGIDISSTTIKLAKEQIKKSKQSKRVKLLIRDMIKMNLKENADLVFCYATFYHIPSYLSLDTLKQFNKALKKGGYSFIDFGFKERDYTLKKQLFELIWFLGHSIKKINKSGFLVTVIKFTTGEIEDLVRLAGFKIIKNWAGIYLLKKIKEVKND